MARDRKGIGGRPRLFNSPEELQIKINEFYDYCEENEAPLTFERLAVFVGMDRKTIYNYEDRDEYFYTIKAVRERILADIMQKGLTNEINSTFGIFMLKNYGYTDKQEIETKNENVNKNTNVDMNHLTTEQIKELLRNE